MKFKRKNETYYYIGKDDFNDAIVSAIEEYSAIEGDTRVILERIELAKTMIRWCASAVIATVAAWAWVMMI